jgi:hypothetical protein
MIIIIIIVVSLKGWVKEGSNKSNGMCYFKYFPYCKLSISNNFCGFRGKASSPTKYRGILILVTGIFLIGGTFKSPELNAFPKLQLLKILLLFSHPWAPTLISVKRQFASTTPNKFIE